MVRHGMSCANKLDGLNQCNQQLLQHQSTLTVKFITKERKCVCLFYLNTMYIHTVQDYKYIYNHYISNRHSCIITTLMR